MKAGNVIPAASRRRVAPVAIYPGASVFPSDSYPDPAASVRAAIVYWEQIEIPAGSSSDRSAIVYWEEIRIPG